MGETEVYVLFLDVSAVEATIWEVIASLFLKTGIQSKLLRFSSLFCKIKFIFKCIYNCHGLGITNYA